MADTGNSIYQFFGSLLNKANFPPEESTMLQNKLMYILVCRTYPQICDSLTPHQDQTLKMTCRLFLTNPNQALTAYQEFAKESPPNLITLISKLMKTEAETMIDDLIQVFSLHSRPSEAESIKLEFHSLTQ